VSDVNVTRLRQPVCAVLLVVQRARAECSGKHNGTVLWKEALQEARTCGKERTADDTLRSEMEIINEPRYHMIALTTSFEASSAGLVEVSLENLKAVRQESGDPVTALVRHAVSSFHFESHNP
jgi:hypothetical protein